jgi:hypothetical protein
MKSLESYLLSWMDCKTTTTDDYASWHLVVDEARCHWTGCIESTMGQSSINGVIATSTVSAVID